MVTVGRMSEAVPSTVAMVMGRRRGRARGTMIAGLGASAVGWGEK